MRKGIGAVACASLMTALLWWVSLGETAEALAPRSSGASGVGKSARDLLAEGKTHYRQERYADAVRVLEAAQGAGGDISEADRKQLDNYLAFARSKAADETVVRGQSSDSRLSRVIAAAGKNSRVAEDPFLDGPSEPQIPASAGQRGDTAKRLLTEARQKFNTGKVAEAEKLARDCQQLGVRPKMFGDSPEKLLEDVKEYRQQDAAWKKDSTSNAAKRERSNYLLRRARQLTEENELASAERFIRESEQIKVQREAFDLQPSQLRQQMARKIGTVRPSHGVVHAGGALPADAKKEVKLIGSEGDRQDLSLDDSEPAPAKATAAKSSRPAGPPDAFRMRADLLMQKARQAMSQGHEEDAHRWATAAQRLEQDNHISYGAEEESPTKFLAQFESRFAPLAKNVAQAPVKRAKGQGATVPSKGETPETSNKQQAVALLQQAEQDLAAGRLDEAREKAQRAKQLDVVYDVMEADPDFLLSQVDRASRTGLLAGKGKSPSKSQAAALTEQARADLNSGRVGEARTKADKARDMDVAYDLMEDTPDDVLSTIEQTRGAKNVARGKGAPANDSRLRQAQAQPDEFAPEMPADNLLDEPAPAGNVNLANDSAAPEFEDPAVIQPSGLSAHELYQRGKLAIQQGNSDVAYRFFLEAYQSGERLDARKMREIQEYLAQHPPKRGKKIKLMATRQAPASDLEIPEVDDSPRRLDVVDEQRQVALEKLRTELRNSMYRAERLAETDPAAAVGLIDKAQMSVENSGFEGPTTAPMLRALAKSRDEVEKIRKLNAPRIELTQRNKEVQSQIRAEQAEKVRIEQDFADLVEKYQDLYDQKRFGEAEVIAKKAKQIAPENPVAEVMVLKAKFAKQDDFNTRLKEDKADKFTEQLNDVELAALSYTADFTHGDAKKWKEMSGRREKYKRPDNRTPTKEELRIEKSLAREVSLHFDNTPLSEVIKHLGSLAEVNVVLDPAGLEEEGITTNTQVSINVDGIRMKSALNLLLDPMRLGYTVKDEVLKITSRIKQQGELSTLTYPVADLVVPIHSFNPPGQLGMTSSGAGSGDYRPGFSMSGRGQMNVGSTGGLSHKAGQAFAQIEDREGARSRTNPFGGSSEGNGGFGGGSTAADFTELIELITSTVDPESWDAVGGPGSVREFNTTLSLVIRQTQQVHDGIADLLGQLRRLQDLQVTIEVRFITVSDRFFERIGIDFDFNIHDNVGDGGFPGNFGAPFPPFGNGTGSTTTTQAATQTGQQAGQTQTGQQAGQQTGAQAAGVSGTGGVAPFNPGPTRQLINQNAWPRYGNVVGLEPNNTFPNDLDIPFRQGSFPIGVPKFGGFQPDAGLQVGLAILSDIETFFLINAAQGDERNNLLFAPKVTLFNGQTATVQSTVQRPFVTSLIPTVGFFSVGFQPQITVLSEGVTLSVLAVISADRRYVRLTVIPSFTSITDVQTFSFLGGSGGANANQAGNQAGNQTGTGFGGQGFGGGQGQQGGAQVGVGGIGGQAQTGQQGGQQTGTQTGQQTGQQQGQTAGAATNITVQQPVFEIVSVTTTVSVPDGGTVLLGGVKRLREGRTMAGVPILNKIPYISRLFKNTGVGRETESLMMMVTPRIIIQEEEEELLGVETQ